MAAASLLSLSRSIREGLPFHNSISSLVVSGSTAAAAVFNMFSPHDSKKNGSGKDLSKDVKSSGKAEPPPPVATDGEPNIEMPRGMPKVTLEDSILRVMLAQRMLLALRIGRSALSGSSSPPRQHTWVAWVNGREGSTGRRPLPN